MLKRVFAVLLLAGLCFQVFAQQKTTAFSATLDSTWWFNIKNKKVNKVHYSKDGYNGDSAMVLTNGEAGWNIYAGYRQGQNVKEGDMFSASVMIRGKGRAGLFVKFYDAAGKEVAGKGVTKHIYQFATAEWKPMQLKFRTPKDVVKITLAVRTIGEPGAISFSDLKIGIESGLVLKNEKITAVFDPVKGAMINSLILAENGFDFTRKDLVLEPGGLCRDIVPGHQTPGVFSKEYYTATVLEPGRRIRFSRLNPSGALSGLKLDKEFSLAPGATEIKVTASFTNTGKNPITTSYRIHNIISNANGTFSWPLNDWVQVFKYDSADPYGIYKITAAPIRAGWFARTYEKINKTLLLQFTSTEADKGYVYLTKTYNTFELYYKDFTLEPAETRKYHYSLSIIPMTGKEHYTDEYGKKQPVQKIVLKKLPKVPAQQSALPEKYRNHFPFSVRLGHYYRGVRSGGAPQGQWNRDLVFENTKAAIDNYCNAVYSWNIGVISKINKDGKNVYGELLRRLDATYSDIQHVCKKSDIEITPEFMKSVPARMKKFRDKDIRKFMENYNDRLLGIYTADEIEGQNAETMIYLHNELSKLLPKDVLPFPYLMITGEPLIPYLPIFLMDSYPMHLDVHGGRNPWAIYTTFKRLVQVAGKDKPVWFMPQGFGSSNGGYVMPNDAETKLMLNLSVAAGVKGIVYYGMMSHGWPWVFKGYDDISAFGVAGQYTSCWKAIGSVARQLGGVGTVVARSYPGPLPAGIKINTRTFNSDKFNTVKQLYRGPAVSIDALKTPEGTLLCVVNRNVYEPETAEIFFGGNKTLDVASMKIFDGGSRKFTLQPGDACYYFVGKDPAPIRDEIFRGMFIRERARYRLFLDQAVINGIKYTEADFSKYTPEQAYNQLLSEFASLRKKVDSSVLGRCLKAMEQAKLNLYPIDELFAKNLNIVVSESMRKHRHYPPHEDPEVQKSRDALYKAFFRLNYFNLAIADGKAAKIVDELEKFAAETVVINKDACEMIRKRQSAGK